MGLISKTTIMKWHNVTKEYYEERGYIFTKYGDEFEVKVEDLPKGSRALVSVKCDGNNCGKIDVISWNDFLKRVNNNKTYCYKCKYHKDKGFESFEQWCIENNRQDVLTRWDYELNDCLPNEISSGTEKKYYFKCPRNIHPSELKCICSFKNRQGGEMDCKKCNSFAQYLIDLYGDNSLDLYFSDKNVVSPWEINKSSKQKVYIKCQEKDYHEDTFMACNDFNQGRRCSFCSGRKTHPLDSLGKLLEDANLLHTWSEKNKKSPYDYMPKSNKKVWWKCLDDKHKDYSRSISGSNECYFRCPSCIQERTESILQEKVRLYLESLNNEKFTILHEYNCTIVPINPKTNHQLPFDNEIKELKLICEVHGTQHYRADKWCTLASKRNNTTPEYELHMQKVRDRYKRIKAIQNNYFYLEIPYWLDDKEETWKHLIDNKLKEINYKKE